ncbi:hypothetical protein DFJ73DRAFT_801528 [Zopfochytrium polystomum]|nr:hypothetical protein DFJ73DRAFT_801528 [Zopfochytrium polystomum]
MRPAANVRAVLLDRDVKARSGSGDKIQTDDSIRVVGAKSQSSRTSSLFSGSDRLRSRASSWIRSLWEEEEDLHPPIDATAAAAAVPSTSALRTLSTRSRVFLLLPARGLSAFLPFVLLHTVSGMAIICFVATFPGYLRASTAGAGAGGAVPVSDKALGTFLCSAGTDLAALGLLMTCRTTVAQLRRVDFAAAAVAAVPHDEERTLRRRIRRRDGGGGGGSVRRDRPLSPLARLLPCIDWSLLKPGSWGRVYCEIAVVWGVVVAFKSFSMAAALLVSTALSDAVEALLSFVAMALAVFVLVERSPDASKLDKVKLSMLASLVLCGVTKVARYTLSGALFLALIGPNFYLKAFLTQAVFDSLSVTLCFHIPDIPRLRLILLRSLAPATTKVPALFSDRFTRHHLWTHWRSHASSPTPSTPDRDDAESLEEFDCAASALTSYALCIRQISTAVSRTALLFPFSLDAIFTIAPAFCVWQWLVTLFVAARIRVQIGRAAAAREGISLRLQPAPLDLIAPIPPFPHIPARPPPPTSRRPSFLPQQHGSANPAVSPFTPLARLRLLAASHYAICIGHATGCFLSLALVVTVVHFGSGSTTPGFRASLGDNAAPTPFGAGVAAGIVPPVPYPVVAQVVYLIGIDLAGNAAVAWWLAGWGGVCYGSGGGGGGGGMLSLGGRRAAGAAPKEQEPAEGLCDAAGYLGDAVHALFGTAAMLFAAGCIIRGIAGPV